MDRDQQGGCARSDPRAAPLHIWRVPTRAREVRSTHLKDEHRRISNDEEESLRDRRGRVRRRDPGGRLRFFQQQQLHVELEQQRLERPERLRLRAPEPADPGQHQRDRRRQAGRPAVRPPRLLRRQGQRLQRGRRVHHAERRRHPVHHQAQGRLEVHRRHPGDRRVLHQVLELHRQREERAEGHLLLLHHRRLRRSAERRLPQGRRAALRPEGCGRQDLHRRHVPAGRHLPDQGRLPGVRPAAGVLLQGPEGLRRGPGRQRPVQVLQVGSQQGDRPRQEPRLQGQ